jgi:hypothetical protein
MEVFPSFKAFMMSKLNNVAFSFLSDPRILKAKIENESVPD